MTRQLNNYNGLQARWTERQLVTAVLRYGGESGYINSCAFNKHGAFRQVSASNPPQRKAANRCLQWYRDSDFIN